MWSENGGMFMSSLSGLIDLLRQKGVTRYDGPLNDSRVSLELAAAAADAAMADSDDKVEVKGKLGKDGLTKQEQMDLYGRVIDAE